MTPPYPTIALKLQHDDELIGPTGNAYYTLFPTLAAHGIQTHAFDQRGWGRSVTHPCERGLTGPTSLVLDDITSVLTSVLLSSSSSSATPSPPVPVFLMGHSMGGAEILTYAALGPPAIRAQISGYIAEAPLIALHPDSQPSRLKVFLGRMAGWWLPERQMVQRLEAKWLCRDESVCEAWVADELCHDTGTLEGLSGILGRGEDLEWGRVKVEDEGVRVWVGHGTRDMVTSFEASRRWVEGLRVRDKEFKAYDGWFHKCRCCCVGGACGGLVLTRAIQCMRSLAKTRSLSPTTWLVGS